MIKQLVMAMRKMSTSTKNFLKGPKISISDPQDPQDLQEPSENCLKLTRTAA